MNQVKICSRALPTAMLLLAMVACGGGGQKVGQSGLSARPQLLGVEIGRLVDVYAYQRIDANQGDRRRRFNRQLVLVQKNVVVNPNIESQSLFDAGGEEVAAASYELRPFDKSIGHEELLILWDNRPGPESAKFDASFAAAQQGLTSLSGSFRGQNTLLRPMPVVPRNAALKLRFSAPLTVDGEFFETNPSAVQLLEFKGDPDVVAPVDAFRVLSARLIPQGDVLVVDTTILGGEGASGFTTVGLPASADSTTANIRIAIPSRGASASSFYVKEDPIAELNGKDSLGRSAIIRDFRSGNLNDGPAGKLFEPESPMIIGGMSMGITSVDAANNIVVLNKRLNFVPVRGRYPFVEGPLDNTLLPMGPVATPAAQALHTGDILTQTIQVLMSDGSFEAVTLRAEVLQNLEIGTVLGGTVPIGLSAVTTSGEEQGQMLPVVRVKLASLKAGVDSLGRTHSFEANALPEGKDCLLRAYYYENVPFVGSTLAVSDSAWRHRFLRIDPQPPASATPGSLVSPVSSVAVEFSKPMDLDQVDSSANLLITNTSVLVESFAQQMSDPKRATARVVPTRLSDVSGDATVLRLQAPMGLFHRASTAETYCVHVKLGADGAADLSGNSLSIFADPTIPLDSWSVDFRLNPAAPPNLVGWKSWLFSDADEDGSLPGSVDIFGQFRLLNGRLFGAPTVRFSRTADNQNLSLISRIHRGECWDPLFDPVQAALGPLSPQGLPTPLTAPTDSLGAPHPGLLYWQPKMVDQVAPPNVPQVYEYWGSLPQNVGRVVEPHQPRGSRMQMRYIEDDFTLDYRQPVEFGVDVEQLYWSPFNDEAVYYDVFDRYSMSLAHSGRRPDIQFRMIPGDSSATPPVLPGCQYVCASNNSALSTRFADNVLPGTQAVPVFEDKVYTINPNQAFRSPSNTKFVPYPRFDRSYTWRDSRLITVDASGQLIGLGGADQPTAQEPNRDFTAHIDSPWITSVPAATFVNAGLGAWVMDEADFRGDRRHDHDPIALPLLVDWKVFPDSAVNGFASGANSFQMAMLGSPSFGFPAAPGGYYDRRGAGCGPRPPWPSLRAQASGGEDLLTQAAILIDPANQETAQASLVKDAGLGNPTRAIFPAPARDGMMNWAQANLVRKVSTQTFGFFDTLNPQRAQFVNDPTGSPSVVSTDGFPDLDAVSPGLRIIDFVAQLDPPQSRQPAGTSIVLEVRGAAAFTNSGVLYNPTFDLAGQVPNDTFDGRGNLLNPNYACEAYRYSQPNSGSGFNTPRVAATGLTRYVTDDQLDLIRDSSRLLPRFLNVRLTMTNNVDVSPALSPSLRSMSIVYRMAQSN